MTMKTRRQIAEAIATLEATIAAIDSGELEADNVHRAHLAGAVEALREVLQ
ncbi:hypothetical protein NQ036_03480 [Brevibacterium sp. 91QC2O2]|uniref:hypothetical protein n=1 Tax=Brevibacterium sp. 91QC2O2 TaxID=2968458 RepID=UPI00211B9E3A|nr:hypothetical protein [Brevibacterium sp. 91QC2O2]MCQ9367308.1 hypothetical protein [Brevibacterium sp. 91QC2O2]